MIVKLLLRTIRQYLSNHPVGRQLKPEINKSYLVSTPPESCTGVVMSILYKPTECIKIYHYDQLYYFHHGTFVVLDVRHSRKEICKTFYTMEEVVIDHNKLVALLGSKWSIWNNCYTVTKSIAKPIK